jgi:hypothetical protein
VATFSLNYDFKDGLTRICSINSRFTSKEKDQTDQPRCPQRFKEHEIPERKHNRVNGNKCYNCGVSGHLSLPRVPLPSQPITTDVTTARSAPAWAGKVGREVSSKIPWLRIPKVVGIPNGSDATTRRVMTDSALERDCPKESTGHVG